MTRTIRKQLATAEDMAIGHGFVTQQRGQQQFQLHKLAIAVGLATEDQLTGLDPVQFPRAKYGAKEFYSENGTTYQEMLALTPYRYETGYVLTEANPYLYAEGYILKRISNLPYTLTGNVVTDKIAPVSSQDWEIVIYSGAAGYNFLDPLTFQTGATLNTETDALLWPVEYGGNGWYYKWTGDFEKVVPPNSSPETTGGIGAGKWLAVNLFQSFIQEDKPVGNIPAGARWYKPSAGKTYLYSIVGAAKHWIQEFVASTMTINLEAPIYLEDFSTTAGTGGDDTPAFAAACNQSVSSGRGVMFKANKTYRLRSKPTSASPYMIKNFLKGMPGSKVEAYDAVGPDGLNQWRRLLPITGANLEISGFIVDGKISADPANWATGYDSFVGSRGLVLTNCYTTWVHDVKTYNTMWAGIAHYNCENSTIERCYTQRCRGNFGDGFYMWGRNFLYANNITRDMTRIGFVAETNEGTQLTRNGKYLNCEAYDGHDASGLYGGVEGNVGFWFENYINVDAELCYAENFLEGGFKSVPSYLVSTQPSVAKIRKVSTYFRNCLCNNVRYGFIVDNIQQGLQNRTVIEGGGAIDVNIGVYIGVRTAYTVDNRIDITGLQVRISKHTVTSQAVMSLASTVKIKDMEVIFDDNFNQALWDDDLTSGYCTFGTFDNYSPTKITIENVTCHKEIAGVKTELGVRTKFNSAGTRDKLKLLRFIETNTDQIANRAKVIEYINCEPLSLGSDIVVDKLLYDTCKLTKRRQFGSTQVFSAEATCKDMLFKNCELAFDTPNDYLYIYNTAKNSAGPIARLQNCYVTRNFETNGSPIRFDADPDFKNANNGVFNLEINQTTFINTGGVTTNPIVTSSFEEVDNATVYGAGNFKSPTITNDTSNFLRSYF